jgi:serine/threonine protein kinase
LIDSGDNVAITDFWQNRFQDLGLLNPEPATSLDLIAPELHVPGGYSHKVDVFSFGIILQQVLETAPSEILSSLSEKCLSKEPANRPSFCTIYEEFAHSHFQLFLDVNFSQIQQYALHIINGE